MKMSTEQIIRLEESIKRLREKVESNNVLITTVEKSINGKIDLLLNKYFYLIIILFVIILLVLGYKEAIKLPFLGIS